MFILRILLGRVCARMMSWWNSSGMALVGFRIWLVLALFSVSLARSFLISVGVKLCFRSKMRRLDS